MDGIEIVHSGDDFFERLLEIISKAQKEIHLQTYIFDHDSTGILIAHALKEAADRNVKVYVLLDSYGARSLPSSFINDLVKHNIHFRYFSPLFSFNNFYLGRRLHQKVVVADGVEAMVGGINIADKYRGTHEKHPWLDYAIHVKGEVALSLQELCRNFFYKKKKFRRVRVPFVFKHENGPIIRILRNDWLKRRNDIGRSYLRSFKSTKKEVIILGSYFFPGKRFLSILNKTARKRGVKVKLILSKNVDVPIVGRATRYLYGSLMKNNVEIYEWKRSVLHGKVAVIDNKWSTIGSFNINHLSSYGSIELNIGVHSEEFSNELSTELNKIISQCDFVSKENLKLENNAFSKVLDAISYYMLRFLSVAVTYFSYKRFFKSLVNNEE